MNISKILSKRALQTYYTLGEKMKQNNEFCNAIQYRYIRSKASKRRGTIVFLHGLGLDQTIWDLLINYLPDCDALTYNLRWHGNCSSLFYTTEEENWQQLIQDYLILMDKKGIDTYHLVCHGLGAILAVEMINRQLIQPLTVTILSTPFYYPRTVAEEGMKFRADKMKNMTGREFGEWLLPQILHSQDLDKRELVIRAFTKARIDVYMALLGMAAKIISLEKLTKIMIPTQVLTGEYDLNFPPSLTTLSINYLQLGSVKIISQASNLVHVDQPKQTAMYIKRFIQENHQKNRAPSLHQLKLPYLNSLYNHMKEQSTLLVRVDFLHLFKISINGHELHGKWNRRKARELIAYIAFYGKSSKDKLCDALWPDHNKRSAQNLLRVSIHHLRSIFNDNGVEHLIFTDTQYVWLNPDVQIQCDVKEVLEGKGAIPSTKLLFSDLPVDWALHLQYELERKFLLW